MLAAYRLLHDPENALSVLEVAHRCGMFDAPRFSRLFRDLFGISARELRRGGAATLPKWAHAYDVEEHRDKLIIAVRAG